MNFSIHIVSYWLSWSNLLLVQTSFQRSYISFFYIPWLYIHSWFHMTEDTDHSMWRWLALLWQSLVKQLMHILVTWGSQCYALLLNKYPFYWNSPLFSSPRWCVSVSSGIKLAFPIMYLPMLPMLVSLLIVHSYRHPYKVCCHFPYQFSMASCNPCLPFVGTQST